MKLIPDDTDDILKVVGSKAKVTDIFPQKTAFFGSDILIITVVVIHEFLVGFPRILEST